MSVFVATYFIALISIIIMTIFMILIDVKNGHSISRKKLLKYSLVGITPILNIIFLVAILFGIFDLSYYRARKFMANSKFWNSKLFG